MRLPRENSTEFNKSSKVSPWKQPDSVSIKLTLA
nr:MAG TPA: hypothetical protein [Caudoviricetes sp.]